MHQDNHIRNILVQIYFSSCRNSQPIYQRWMKESTPFLFHMKGMVRDITLDPIGVPHLLPRIKECPPKSGSVPDRCQI